MFWSSETPLERADRLASKQAFREISSSVKADLDALGIDRQSIKAHKQTFNAQLRQLKQEGELDCQGYKGRRDAGVLLEILDKMERFHDHKGEREQGEKGRGDDEMKDEMKSLRGFIRGKVDEYEKRKREL